MLGIAARRIALAPSFVTLAALAVSGTRGALAATSTTQGGVTRTLLAQSTPENAPGQELYLQEVRIAPGAKLATHLHEGTQIATIRSGLLTYNIISGTASVTRAHGRAENVTGPATIRLRQGDAITETATLVHYGANKGKQPVVVLLAALLRQGSPLATPVGGSP